jgi:LysM repeat protein
MSKLRRSILGGVLGIFIVGCTPSEGVGTPQPADELQPYIKPSPTLRTTIPAPTLPTPESIGPTPTPLTYTIQEGDTLLGVAIRYGLELEQLLAVNPGVNPRALSIGQQIYIPALEGDPAEVLLATPTPVPLNLSSGQCYPTPTGDVWCSVEVQNDLSSSVEGISVLFTLLGAGGEPLSQDVVFSPLNRLRAGDRMPVFAFFDDFAQEFIAVDVRIQSAIVYTHDVERYANLDLQVTDSEPSLFRKRWRLGGTITVPEGVEADEIRAGVLVMALDENDRVVGFTKWEPETMLRPGQRSPFDITVFSLGPEIERVETQSEGLILSANPPS